VKIIDKAGFGKRFKQAFKDATNTEIADKIGRSNAAITNYIKGRIPDLEILDEIAYSTGCSIHWLLTGEGSQYVEQFYLPSPSVPLAENEKQAVTQLAKANNQSVDQTLHELLTEALKARGLLPQKPTPSMLLFRQDIKLVALPMIGAISAGQPIRYFKEQKEVLVADVFIISQEGYQSFVLQIVGEDFTDEGFSDGNYLICCDNKQPQSGQVAIVVIDGEYTTVKRIFFEGPSIRLQPTNGKGDGELFPPDRIAIIATVTGVQRNP